jgi:hypothetical protein
MWFVTLQRGCIAKAENQQVVFFSKIVAGLAGTWPLRAVLLKQSNNK